MAWKEKANIEEIQFAVLDRESSGKYLAYVLS